MATVTKRGASYRIRVSAGYDANGKQIMKSATWTPAPGMTERQIEKELERQKVIFEDKVKSGKCYDGKIKLQAFAEKWFEDYAAEHLRPRTYYRYKEMSDRVYAGLGHLRLDQIQPRHLLEFYAQLAEPGQNQRTGGGLSDKTIKNYHAFVSSILERAVKWGLIDSNPCHRVDAPKAQRHDPDFMEGDDLVAFISALQDEPLKYQTLFMLLIYTGMRRGEVLGLEWADIDLDSGVVSIIRTSQYVPEKGTYTDATKTAQSARSLKLPDDMVSLLKAYRAEQAETRLQLGDAWVDSGRVFTREDGGPMYPNLPYTALQRILDKHGLKRVSLHSLRHTNATLLIQQGVDVRTVSGRLGHSQTSTTMNIYAHQIQSADAAAAEAIDLAIKTASKKA